jgi:hypothetical protein
VERQSGLVSCSARGPTSQSWTWRGGTVGFVDTMKDPDRIDHRVADELLSFMTGLASVTEGDPANDIPGVRERGLPC